MILRFLAIFLLSCVALLHAQEPSNIPTAETSMPSQWPQMTTTYSYLIHLGGNFPNHKSALEHYESAKIKVQDVFKKYNFADLKYKEISVEITPDFNAYGSYQQVQKKKKYQLRTELVFYTKIQSAKSTELLTELDSLGYTVTYRANRGYNEEYY